MGYCNGECVIEFIFLKYSYILKMCVCACAVYPHLISYSVLGIYLLFPIQF